LLKCACCGFHSSFFLKTMAPLNPLKDVLYRRVTE
jgi:hypothetical protein